MAQVGGKILKFANMGLKLEASQPLILANQLMYLFWDLF